MYTVTAPKKEENKIYITVNPWEVSTGHRRFGKQGPHKDKRRTSKTQARIKFKRELDY
jgi:hypothetical protein